MWHLASVKFQFLSYLWINVANINSEIRYNKNHFIFLSSSRTRDKLKFYRLSDATFYDLINTIYQFIKPFLDAKMSIFEEYGAFKE